MCTDPGCRLPERGTPRDHRRVSLISTVQTPAHELSRAVGELRRLIDRIADAALVARGLADSVDWQAKSATTFHDRATTWAGEVTALCGLAETARHDAQRASDRAALAESGPDGLIGACR